jgi:hypothetical protein
MMKNITLILAIVLLAATNANAERYSSRSKKTECPYAYIGLSTGFGNPSGILGFNMDIPLMKQLSVAGGIGMSYAWGWKSMAELRYYFAPKCNSGWAVGAGITHNTGFQSMTWKLAVKGADTMQNVTFDEKPLLNPFVSAYKFWTMGKNGSRFYIQAGYSLRLVKNYYTVTSGHTLTDEGRFGMQLLAPGGIMLAAGFSFGLGKG